MYPSNEQPAARIARAICFALGALLLGAGCQTPSKQDNRPSWVQQAESRLAGKPFYQVAKGQSTSQARETPSENSRRNYPASATTGSTAQNSKPAARATKTAQPMPTPKNIEWGEKKITVEVEN